MVTNIYILSIKLFMQFVILFIVDFFLAYHMNYKFMSYFYS
jgi:hypothetical protein